MTSFLFCVIFFYYAFNYNGISTNVKYLYWIEIHALKAYYFYVLSRPSLPVDSLSIYSFFAGVLNGALSTTLVFPTERLYLLTRLMFTPHSSRKTSFSTRIFSICSFHASRFSCTSGTLIQIRTQRTKMICYHCA